MRAYDIIAAKRDGATLSREQIDFMVQGYVEGQIPDYQMAAFCMAVYFRGMTHLETAQLTDAMARWVIKQWINTVQAVWVTRRR